MIEWFDLHAHSIQERAPDTCVNMTLTKPAALPTAVQAAGAALLTDQNGNQSFGNAIQSGISSLTNGVTPAIPAYIGPLTTFQVTTGTRTPGAGNLTQSYDVLDADIIAGTPGSFKVTATNDAGTIQNLDQTTKIYWQTTNG